MLALLACATFTDAGRPRPEKDHEAAGLTPGEIYANQRQATQVRTPYAWGVI